MTSQILADQTTIERLAQHYRCDLVRMLTIDVDTFMPTTLIIATAAQLRVEVVITPDLDHFGTGYKAVPCACAVLLPAGMIPRRPRPTL